MPGVSISGFAVWILQSRFIPAGGWHMPPASGDPTCHGCHRRIFVPRLIVFYRGPVATPTTSVAGMTILIEECSGSGVKLFCFCNIAGIEAIGSWQRHPSRRICRPGAAAALVPPELAMTVYGRLRRPVRRANWGPRHGDRRPEAWGRQQHWRSWNLPLLALPPTKPRRSWAV